MTTTFKVAGVPVPQPRHKFRVMLRGTFEAIRRAIVNGGSVRDVLRLFMSQAYIPKDHPIHDWKQLVRFAFDATGAEIAAGPLFVSIGIVTKRPKSKIWKTKPMPREWDTRGGHGHSGDCDNFAKAIIDALNGAAWGDDSQIVRLSTTKVIAAGGEHPGAFVKIEPANSLIPNCPNFKSSVDS